MAGTLDGADNRDLTLGGLALNVTQESIEEFRLTTNDFTAADGRTSGAVLTMVTKSGTNQLQGSGFVFNRNTAMTAKDYFTKVGNRPELDFNRGVYGGSLGGPLRRNRTFFFGAFEWTDEESSLSVPDALYNQQLLLVPFGATPIHEIPQPGTDARYTVKVNEELGANHSLLVRYAAQHNRRFGYDLLPSNDLSMQQRVFQDAMNAIAQHSWVANSRTVNQLTFAPSRFHYIVDFTNNGEWFVENYPNVPAGMPALVFPSVKVRSNSEANGGRGFDGIQDQLQIRDDLSLQLGTHAVKVGATYSWFPHFGYGKYARNPNGVVTFFDDPSVILSNSNGRYPQGFQTPGIVARFTQGSFLTNFTTGQDGSQSFGTWVQDDWRLLPQLTLNLGVRYDLDLGFWNQKHQADHAFYQVLKAIGSPYGVLPKTPTREISPRVGFAYDLEGDGRRVLRGGYGIYRDYIQRLTPDPFQRPMPTTLTLINTGIGVGQLATYRFGIDPQPPAPVGSNTLPSNSSGQWFAPNAGNPWNWQAHIGYAHQLASNTTFSVDYTHTIGQEYQVININPLVNGVGKLAPALAQVYGDPNLLGPVALDKSVTSRSQFDALMFRYQQRFPRATFQTHYTLARSLGYSSTRDTGGAAQNDDDPFGPGAWGPGLYDERHRLVALGVFDLPYGVQLSPILQLASARPYNLTAGVDLNRNGTNNDFYVDPATGQPVSVNSARGDRTSLLDMRLTKFLPFGATRRLGLFVEVFNVFNRANFGNRFQGNARSAVFRQPIALIPSIGYPRQVQLGARFEF